MKKKNNMVSARSSFHTKSSAPRVRCPASNASLLSCCLRHDAAQTTDKRPISRTLRTTWQCISFKIACTFNAGSNPAHTPFANLRASCGPRIPLHVCSQLTHHLSSHVGSTFTFLLRSTWTTAIQGGNDVSGVCLPAHTVGRSFCQSLHCTTETFFCN